jgi:guanosine-3',5'-bis(diphosphate) 3'-pyrophosphohydrolase
MIRQVELVERVLAYDPDANEDVLNRAYVFSMKAHGSQKRASGDPYFSHPLEVAAILTNYKLDTATIATALLHDTIEDTVATYEEIERLFGPEIAKLVDGVTKLSRLEVQSERNKQAENFRKLLLAMSNDIRVLLVKLADRLHNMRTLHYIKEPEKRRRIALETMEIYAPLAERIGMQEIKDELEDLSFGVLHPEVRDSIMGRLEYLRGTDSRFVDRIVDHLKRTLANSGIEAWVSGREKRPVSIWRKMQTKNVGFEQLSDIVAFRIVVKDVDTCYRSLGVVHANYPTVPGRFKDYISTPKPNGYRSIHTAVLGPEGHRIEVQIRTAEMHEVAEVGVAAHWKYKQGEAGAEGQQYRWLRELLEILEQAEDPEEFLEHTKLSMFQDQVFCFTPKGDLFALPRGATPVDFAYAVHSDVGDTCVGAKVNGRLVPLRTELKNGDQVEILRSKTQTPSPTWEGFVVTGKARSCIRRFIRNQQRTEYAALGRQIAQKAFKEAGETFTEKAIEAALKALKMKTVEDVYVALGDGNLTDRAMLATIFPGRNLDQQAGSEKVVPLARARARQAKGSGSPVSIRGLIPGMAVHFAGCCHPLPGDRIVGIVATGRGVTIHTIDCDTLEQFADDPDRWLDVAWDRDPDGADRFTGRINTVVTNEPGALSALTTVIARYGANINNLRITNRSGDFFEMVLDLEVKDVKHLTNIIAALRASPVISSVERARG